MALTRREVCGLLPLLMATATGYSAETNESNQTLKSTIYDFRNLPVHKSVSHNSIPLFRGNTHSGVPVELHETELAPGAMPHPSHHHVDEELFMVREGAVEVDIDGKRSQLGPGSVAYIASNAEHGVRNTSQQWATYFVLLLGSPRA